MLRVGALSAAVLLVGADASLAERVAAGIYDPELTAAFGGDHGNRKAHARGSLSFQHGGKPGYTAVNWTTSEITIPTALVRRVCGSLPNRATFTYSINSRWEHRSGKHWAQGPEECGAAFVGGHWDPTAACSEESDNEACQVCGTARGYACDAETFSPAPDAKGSFAYRFLNEHACELGDLSGMHGELEATGMAECGEDQSPRCGEWAESGECQTRPEYLSLLCPRSCGTCTGRDYLTLRSVVGDDAGLAQMSTPFGVVSRDSVVGSLIGLNCDASGPPPVHGTDCKCLRYNGERSPSIGTITVFRPLDHETFYLGGVGLDEMKGRSISVQCGSSFGDKKGEPLFCAALRKTERSRDDDRP